MPEPVSAQLQGASGGLYTLEAQPLARGGQAAVWGAVDAEGRAVAIKLALASRVSCEAVEREGKMLAWLGAQGISATVPLIDRVTWEGRLGLVMPRLVGDADAHVAGLIAARPRQAIEGVLAFARDLCDGIGTLHGVEVPLDTGRSGTFIHRDIKPDNVLIGPSGAVHLADLGGTLVVDAVGAARLAVFGSPMWAPYDQILPGLPEPNPTWDTYAACVALFWWVTGTRPAFQADPSPILTERGRAIWEALCAVAWAQSEQPERLREAHAAYEAAREGTREVDLVDVRGHAAIQTADLEALEDGIGRLADPSLYGVEAIGLCARDLGELLARGLSPLSHPSPPNRFWDAGRLARELDAVRSRLVSAREARLMAVERAGLAAQVEALQDRGPPRVPVNAPDGRAVTAIPINAGLGPPRDEDTSEEGLDPTPRALRRDDGAASSRMSGAVLGLLGGLAIPARSRSRAAPSRWETPSGTATRTSGPCGR